VRSFSKRARAYICAYYAFGKEKIARRDNQDLLEEADARDDHIEKGSLEYWKIEQMAQQFRTQQLAHFGIEERRGNSLMFPHRQHFFCCCATLLLFLFKS
jgi:hypothetical protein